MDHAFQVGPLFVNLKVQERLTGTLLATGNLLARHINVTNIIGLQKSLGVHRWCAEDFVIADANADIPIIRGGETLVVDAAADVADIELDLVHVHHDLPSICRRSLGESENS